MSPLFSFQPSVPYVVILKEQKQKKINYSRPINLQEMLY